MVRCHPGNYLAFFPSYAYLQLVHTVFSDENADIPTLVQTSAMRESEREAFLGRFDAHGTSALLGFVVMGGIFGEGIDLVGERLHGAVIVGVGLPGIGLERNLIRDYFDERLQAGFDFAYRFPGFNRVCQAVGRVIRTSQDRGAVLLIDRRYGTRPYRALFPPEWQPVELRAGQAVAEVLQPFWCAGALTPNPQSECDHAGTGP
jgi:Rad3-related DNA helicase